VGTVTGGSGTAGMTWVPAVDQQHRRHGHAGPQPAHRRRRWPPARPGPAPPAAPRARLARRRT
jgi:hypothetical protein